MNSHYEVVEKWAVVGSESKKTRGDLERQKKEREMSHCPSAFFPFAPISSFKRDTQVMNVVTNH